MKNHILGFLLLLSFVFMVSAQTKETQKFDEFGNISCDDLTSRLEVFFLELKGDKTLKGYVLIYEGNLLIPLYNKDGKTVRPRRGEAKGFIKSMQSREKFYSFYDKRIVFIESGFRKNFTVELWLVPNGAALPKLTPTLKKMKYRKGKPPEDICKYI